MQHRGPVPPSEPACGLAARRHRTRRGNGSIDARKHRQARTHGAGRRRPAAIYHVRIAQIDLGSSASCLSCRRAVRAWHANHRKQPPALRSRGRPRATLGHLTDALRAAHGAASPHCVIGRSFRPSASPTSIRPSESAPSPDPRPPHFPSSAPASSARVRTARGALRASPSARPRPAPA